MFTKLHNTKKESLTYSGTLFKDIRILRKTITEIFQWLINYLEDFEPILIFRISPKRKELKLKLLKIPSV